MMKIWRLFYQVFGIDEQVLAFSRFPPGPRYVAVPSQQSNMKLPSGCSDGEQRQSAAQSQRRGRRSEIDAANALVGLPAAADCAIKAPRESEIPIVQCTAE
jgi:hypothetical protein